MVELFKQMLETYKENEETESALALIYVGCISADSLLSVEDCVRAMSIIMMLEKALNIADVDDDTRTQWEAQIGFAKEIIERDKKNFQEKL